MQRRGFLASLAGGLASVAGCCRDHSPARTEPQPLETTLALVHGALVDGTGSDPTLDAALVISQGTIQATGPAASTLIPPEAQVVDVSGCTLLPGFINAHVHARYNEDVLKAWARAGVTTVRDLGRTRRARSSRCATS